MFSFAILSLLIKQEGTELGYQYLVANSSALETNKIDVVVRIYNSRTKEAEDVLHGFQVIWRSE